MIFIMELHHNIIMKLALFSIFILLGSRSSLIIREVLATQCRAPCEFPAIINFGDSNSDTGGRSAAFGHTGPPHGETFFHAPAGRYSDGRLIIDFMAESMGLPYLHAYLDSMGANFSYGANFAVASATIRPENPNYFSPFSFSVQFKQFYDFKERSQAFRKEDAFKNLLPSSDDLSRALYTFDFGQNDLTASDFSSMSSDQINATLTAILSYYKTYIKNIYNVGARYFWIHNTGPLGCLAYVLASRSLGPNDVDQIGCSIQLNKLAQGFNLELKKVVGQLREEIPLATITYVDIYAIKYDLLSQADKYGFTDPLVVCCGHGGGKYNYDKHAACGATAMINGTEVLVGASCKDPSVKIVWDGAHYTEAANKWVFDRVLNGSYSDPPIPLNMACYKQ